MENSNKLSDCFEDLLHEFLVKEGALEAFKEEHLAAGRAGLMATIRDASNKRAYSDVIARFSHDRMNPVGFLWSRSLKGNSYWEQLNRKWGSYLRHVVATRGLVYE